MACRNDLEEEKVLIWNTRLPYENEPRTSPAFSLMGSEWCLRFVYRDSSLDYHSITLHQIKDGKILPKVKDLKEPFSVKSYMMPLTEHNNVEIAENTITVNSTSGILYLWYSTKEREKIFKTLNWLYDCPEVKFACKFYGQPSSTFQLEIETDHLEIGEKFPLRTEDKGVQVSPEVPRDIGVQVSSEVPRDIESLSSDFSHLLGKEILPDVRLEGGGRTFQAHRSVLAARSQVFRAMFQNGMLESETGAVKIPDVDVTVLEKLLKFVYTGKPEDISEGTAADLYEAADKYDVHSLKTACAYWIERSLTTENCVKYLVVADSHSDRDLKAAVVTFIIENPSVLKDEAWTTLSKKPSELTNEVFQAYVASTIQ